MRKCVGFSCDGASNMIGGGGGEGTATLLKKDCPSIIIVHRLTHRQKE